MTKVIQNYVGDVKVALCRSNVGMPSFATNIFALIGHLCKRGLKLVGHNYNVTMSHNLSANPYEIEIHSDLG